MDDRIRIDTIVHSADDAQLNQAMDGYRDDSVTLHPELGHNEDFGRLMENRQYMRALEIVRQARGLDTNLYADVIRVLQFAVSRRLAIMMLR